MKHTLEFRFESHPSLEEVESLYRSAGWWSSADNRERLKRILEGTPLFCGAYVDGHLAGMMRALTDFVSDAYLLDLTVAPEYRRQGIGKKIVEMLSSRLRDMGVEWIVCIGAPGTEQFYAETQAEPMTGCFPLRFPDNNEGDSN